MNQILPGTREALSLLTVKQVADLLQVSSDWVFDQVKEDKIPHVRMGRNIRFRPLALQQWLAEQ